MTKIFIISSILLLSFFSMQAQTYLLQEGFENGIPSTWLNVDTDEDGHTWVVYSWEDGYEPHDGDWCVVSSSYDDEEEEALTPDNWLITPPLTIPATLTGENCPSLRWWVAAQDPDYPADHYEIFISTTGTGPDDFGTDAVFIETLATDEWIQHTLNLSPYIGQTIYIAFVHDRCEDEFKMKIDDIEVLYYTEPTLEANTDYLDFGTVIVGETSEIRSFSVTSALLEEGVNVSVSAPFEISPCGATFSQQLNIPANTPATIYVRYTPTIQGNDFQELLISNDELSLSVPLTGSGIVCNSLPLPFYEDFEEDLTPCWTNFDYDDDGLSWMWMDDGYGHESDGYYISYSYDEEIGMDVMPNDWLLTPQISIPQTGAHLTWWVATYVNDWPENTYDVLISTTGTEDGNFTSIFSETLTDETYHQLTLDLSDYAGENIYIAFAHHTNTEETGDSYGMVIDDIAIEEGVGVTSSEGVRPPLIYPNPASDFVNIQNAEGDFIRITDAIGQTILEARLVDGNTQINTSHFAPGVYFIHTDGRSHWTGKFIIER